MAQTLGDLLETFAKQQLSTVEKGSEAIASTNAYVPGFDEVTDMNKAVDVGTTEVRRDEVDFSGHDMSLGSKKALSQYTYQRLIEGSTSNKYPGPTQDEDIGHTKEDALRKTSADNGNFYEPDFLSNGNGTAFRNLAPSPLSELIADKYVRDDKVTLGSFLRDVEATSGKKTTFGKKLRAGMPNGSFAAHLDQNEVTAATMMSLKANKYNPDHSSSPFLLEDSYKAGDGQLSNGMYSLYTGLLGASRAEDSNEYPKSVTVQELRKAALEVLHRAQGVGVDKAGEVARAMMRSGSPFTGTGDLLALIPHVTQVGAGTVPGGVDRLRVRSTEVMEAFTNPGVRAAGQDDLIAVMSYETVLGAGGDEDPLLKSTSQNGKSYGTMNSPSEPFNGVAPFGMILPVIFSIIVLGLIGLGLGAIIAGFASISGFKALTPEDPSSLAFGLNASRGTNYVGAEIGQKFLDMFGLPRDVGLEFFSMVRGIMLFYGIDINPFQPGAAIADAFINLLMGPGYYLVISKKVLADFEQITKAFQNYTKISGINAITIVLASLEALMSSFTVRWFVIMNTIGRIDEDGRVRRGAKAHGESVVSVRDEKNSKTLVTPHNRQKMSRFYPPDGGQGMSPLSARLFNASFLTPSNMADPSDAAVPGTPVGPTSGIRVQSPKEIQALEDVINAEYMPFSIQDLRTNEIISLPAFITNVTDDFAVDHSSTHGFGRTDEVKIYRKTTRNVGFSFKLVAMNPQDHEYIWYVANRFVSMVYPQRDAGRKRRIAVADDNVVEFTQPFSQTISASPVVRIRIGDLIASNASRSGFSQIFGDPIIVTEPSNANEDAAKKAKEISDGLDAVKKIKKLKFAMDLKQARSNFGANTTELLDGMEKLPFIHVPDAAGKAIMKKGTHAFAKVDDKYFQFKFNHPVEIPVGDGKAFNAAAGDDSAKEPVVMYEFDFGSILTDELDAFTLGGTPLLAAFRKANKGGLIPNPFAKPEGAKVFISHNQASKLTFEDNASAVTLAKGENVDGITPELAIVDLVDHSLEARGIDPLGDHNEDEKKIKEGLEKDIGDLFKVAKAGFLANDQFEDLALGTAISEFMAPKNNPVIRSFEASGGRGLAGVITALNFSYDDAVWGTTADEPGGEHQGLRAPKLINITVQFSPIHDLPLGLNHRGEMFAPSHPVGALSRSRLDEGLITATERIEREKQMLRRMHRILPDTDNPGEPKLPF